MDSNVNVFLEATRQKLRFDSRVGKLTVEDLWDLPLTSRTEVNLDHLAVTLSHQLGDRRESFVADADPIVNEQLQLQFAVVKQIIDIKLARREAAKAAWEKAEKKQKILAILERKQDAALENASAEELQSILATL